MKAVIIVGVVLIVGYFVLTHLHVRGTASGIPFDLSLGIGSKGPSDPTAQTIGAAGSAISSVVTSIGGVYNDATT